MQVIKAGSRPPWVGLAPAVWVQFGDGNGYTFPLYSTALKSVMGFNQQQLTILSVANDIGENVGFLLGIACNKFPPWMLLSCGALCCFLGYDVIWLVVSQIVQNMPLLVGIISKTLFCVSEICLISADALQFLVILIPVFVHHCLG